MERGSFVISLDFELYWGVRDVLTREEYGANILGTKTAIPSMVELFEKYNARATFATVGLLFCKSDNDIQQYSPNLKPSYIIKKLSPYEDNFIDIFSSTDTHFYSALEIILQLKNSPNIEIGTHTFSHFYCWEAGQSVDEFEADILAAVKIAENNDVVLKSIVFPRNQVSKEYLRVCAKYGITHYRGNPSRFYNEEGGFKNKILRFVDTYINIGGDTMYGYDELREDSMYNVKASRFFRPYSPRLGFLDSLKLKRIKDEMTSAAMQNKIYHLWWHPHNFGINQKQNLNALESILLHYSMLNQKYEFESQTMSDLSLVH